jgi:acyl-[acyl-carrier-protein] desaturase
MTDVIRRADLYGPRHFLKIVEELIEYWDMKQLTGLGPMGEKALEMILSYPERLARIADKLESRTRPRSFSFTLLDGRSFTAG